MEESFDIFTRDGQPLGSRPKHECHQSNPGFYHKPVGAWIINDQGKILVQKRALSKKTCPGLWDVSSAGHVHAGETSLHGIIRETSEELGLETKPEDYRYIGEYISDSTWEIMQIYLLKTDKDLDAFSLQKEEVEQIKWVSLKELRELMFSDAFVPHDAEFKHMILGILAQEV